MSRHPYAGIFILMNLFLSLNVHLHAQKRWDGGAGDGQWASTANWSPDGVPAATDDVVLDNTLVSGPLHILLPAGSTMQSLNSLSILPAAGDSIMLEIPNGNNASPALNLASAADAILLGNGAVLRNASGATSGETILLAGQLRILNGGHYIHATGRANAYLIDHLATDISTVHGLFEFDVPGSAGYTVSLTGNTFGDLQFSASNTGAKSYSGSGTTDLIVRGHFTIATGASLSSTITADIRLGGNIVVDGNLNLVPVTTGTTGRSLLFSGAPALVKGRGGWSFGANFRNVDMLAPASVMLQRVVLTSAVAHTMIVRKDAVLDMDSFSIQGPGAFRTEDGATLRMGAVAGITLGDSGNVRTASRSFASGATYVYERSGDQRSGNALPDAVAALVTDKPAGALTLVKSVSADTLQLLRGIIWTSAENLLSVGDGGTKSAADAFGRMDEGWINSHVAGPLRLRTGGSGVYRFPLGDGLHHAPIVIHRTGSGTVSFIAQYHFGSYPGDPVSGTYADPKEYWTIRSDGSSPSHDATVDLSWRKGISPHIDSLMPSSIGVLYFDSTASGSSWKALGNLPLVQTAGIQAWVKSDKAASVFQAFRLGAVSAASVLAVFGTLHCLAAGQNNAVQWTGTFSGPSLPILERSTDGIHFQQTGLLPDQHEKYIDAHPPSENCWYRLISSDPVTGQQRSNTCMVNRQRSGGWKIYPQPANAWLQIEAPAEQTVVRYRIIDMVGNTVRSGILPAGKSWRINLSDRGPGVCSLELAHAGGSTIFPLIWK